MRKLFVTTLSLLLFFFTLPAKAENISEDDLGQVRTALKRAGVSQEVEDRLIAKLQAGEIWDSMTPGTEPRTVERSSGVIREIYDDGSLVVTTMDDGELVDGGIATSLAAVSGCRGRSVISSVKYSQCKVEQDSIFLVMGFYFDYSVPVKGTPVVTRAYGWYNRVLFGSSSNNHLERLSGNRAKYSAEISSAIGFSWGGATVGATQTSEVYIMVIVDSHRPNIVVG
ncbi:hypothetical protein [Arachnia propionica]|uniref:Uncharacterized protein n=1 Tax=Arachnia propionica TaxID=1750 RepID=A0A3P1WS30_9ACTN|nr:hypothetical protein [Arachnia propionica]RRD48140.1 hypothetical protein EII35_14185 [Arachnia propionica]